VAELERENSELRAELAASRSRRRPAPAIVFALIGLLGMTALSLAEMAHRSPGLPSYPIATTSTLAPAQNVAAAPEARWVVAGKGRPVRAGASVGNVAYFADEDGAISRFGDAGSEGDDSVPRGADILAIGGGAAGAYAVGVHGTILAEKEKRS